MIKRLMISLFAMGLIAIAGSEVNAGCANIGGTRMCASWITGSEICSDSVIGLGNIKNCTEGVNCPVVTCSAFGTVPLVVSADCTNNFDPDNTKCGIQGIAFCINHGGNASRAQGNPFNLDAVLSATSNITTCDKNGRCRTSIELEPDIPSAEICQNPNWDFVTFTASEFNAEAKVCPGGYDASGQCCATTSRDGASCGTGNTAIETTVQEFCFLEDLTGIKPLVQRAYICVAR